LSQAVATGVPVIDLSELQECDVPTSDMECVEQIREACSGWGFFQITNHGINDKTMETYYEQKQRFFALSKEEKGRIRRTQENSKGWYDDEVRLPSYLAHPLTTLYLYRQAACSLSRNIVSLSRGM
jgi:isopenicillin N synthase-like dioxygenase